jgi:hypothetical protein
MIASIFSGSAVTPDPYFKNTTLLLPGNGTNGATNNTFLDGSTNNFTITRNGNTTQGTFSPFSQTGWGNYFNGSSGYFTTPANAAFAFGTGDFTVEMFVNTSNLTTGGFVSHGPAATSGYWAFELQTGSFYWQASGVANILVVSASSYLSNSVWTHLCVSRVSGTLRMFANGTQIGSATDNTNYSGSSSGSLSIGRSYNNLYTTGYISNLRIVKGTGVTTVTVPTAPLTAISGTSILTCQSNRFVDNSSNAFALTLSGSPSVQAFSPFNPTASWSAATNGGSGYFDGNGDYLTLPAGTAFAPGTGDFTVDGWFYTTVTTANQIIWSQAVSGTNYFIVWADPSTSTVYFNGTLSGGGVNISSTANLQVNAWNYFSVRRASGTVTVYLNGVAGTPTSNTVDFSNTSYVPTIGRYTHAATNHFTGYIANLRYVKGTAITPSGVPTTLNTAVSGTSALLNFTNAGIYDATSKNDLETVGNAQISTAQSKWGGSSMAFDGTGDYLLSPTQQTSVIGTADFTIEMWAYVTDYTTGSPTFNDYGCFIDYRTANTSQVNVLLSFLGSVGGLGRPVFYVNGAIRITGNVISTNAWVHLALCRVSGTTRLFMAGAQAGSNYTDTNNYTSNVFRIGTNITGADGYLKGYLQDVRTTVGYGRYVTGTGANAGQMVFNGTNTLALPTAAFPTL